MRTALITGITGQDGSYLAELLLEKGYNVHGIKRRNSSLNTARIDHIYRDPCMHETRLRLHYADLSDTSSIVTILRQTMPDEIYNLGAQTHVRVSFDIPEYTADVTGIGSLRLLEGVREICPGARFYQASSSEMFGLVQETPQTENTPFWPRSPYGCAKAYAFYITRNYRESYGLFACNGILFNHESPRRGETFVTRKITRAIAAIAAGSDETLFLGNLEAKRDWGYAPDYVEAMYLMMQQDKPDDYVIATGEQHSVREFCELAFAEAGIPILWSGQDEREVGMLHDGTVRIQIDPVYYRPAEVELLVGDASKARDHLGWQPKTGFEELVKIMVAADIEALKKCTKTPAW